MPYEDLSTGFVEAQVDLLDARIDTRFPASDIARASDRLCAIVGDLTAVDGSHRTLAGRWRTAARALAALVAIGTAAALVLAIRDALTHGQLGGADWLSLIESIVSDLVYAAIAGFFLLAFPERIHRRQILQDLHDLRSLAHVVDTHHLAVDPLDTEHQHSPESLTSRRAYLECCAQLLSLIGKTAALCAEESGDPLVLSTVSTVEDLTSAMTRKIWQTIDSIVRG